MRKFLLLSAIAAGALLAGCAQTGNTASTASNCNQLSADDLMTAIEQGSCDVDMATAAGGEPADTSTPDKDDKDGGGDKDPGPDPDPEPGNDPDPEGERDPSTEPGGNAAATE
jgi:outer membrane murein-binding lipoprotein Lpp